MAKLDPHRQHRKALTDSLPPTGQPDFPGKLTHLPIPRRTPVDQHLSIHPSAKKARHQPVQGRTQRTCFRPRRPHHRYELALRHVQVDPVERGLLLSAATVGEPPNADNRLRCGASLSIGKE